MYYLSSQQIRMYNRPKQAFFAQKSHKFLPIIEYKHISRHKKTPLSGG